MFGIYVYIDSESNGRVNATREARDHDRLPTCLPLPTGPLALIRPTHLHSLPAHHRSNRRSRYFRNGSSATFNGSKAVIVEEVEVKEPSPKKRKKAAALAEPVIVEIDDPPPPSRSNPFVRPSEVIEPGAPPQLHTTGLNGAPSAPTISPTTS